MKQNKEGCILILVIHPNDIPERLFRDWVGSRYMVAMVKVNDENQVEVPPEKSRAERARAIASTLSRDPGFKDYILAKMGAVDAPDVAINFIRGWCGIVSRREFATKPEAVDRMFELRDLYAEDQR